MCFVHSFAAPRTRGCHRSQGLGGGGVGGGDSPVWATRVGGASINLPQLVYESLRDVFSRGAVRGLSQPGLHRRAFVRNHQHLHLLLPSIHPSSSEHSPPPMISTSGCSALWWNLGPYLQGCLCNQNITDTWRRWKASGSFFTRTITGYFRAEMCRNNTLRPLQLQRWEALSALVIR